MFWARSRSLSEGRNKELLEVAEKVSKWKRRSVDGSWKMSLRHAVISDVLMQTPHRTARTLHAYICSPCGSRFCSKASERLLAQSVSTQNNCSSFSCIMSRSHILWSDFPQSLLLPHILSQLYLSHSDEQPLDPRTDKRCGRTVWIRVLRLLLCPYH